MLWSCFHIWAFILSLFTHVLSECFPLLKTKARIIFEVNLRKIHPQFIVLITVARKPRVLKIGVRFLVGWRIFTFLYRPDRFWSPPSLLFNGIQGLFPRGRNGRDVKLTSNLQLVPKSRKRRSTSMYPLPASFHGVVLNYLSVGNTEFRSRNLLYFLTTSKFEVSPYVVILQLRILSTITSSSKSSYDLVLQCPSLPEKILYIAALFVAYWYSAKCSVL
jgi:hypothetical protein